MSGFASILAIDTAMNGCSAAVFTDGRSFSESQPMISGQSEHLMPMAGRALEKAGIEYADLDAVIVTVGPGAFTGVRIGISAARGLGLALDIPVFGITTLQTLALQYLKKNKAARLAVLAETKREDFYIQLFDGKGQAISEATAESAAEIAARLAGEEIIFIGDAVARFRGVTEAARGWTFNEGPALPDPAMMAQILAEGGEGSPFLAVSTDPVYLRAPDVSQSKKKQRILGE